MQFQRSGHFVCLIKGYNGMYLQGGGGMEEYISEETDATSRFSDVLLYLSRRI